MKVPHTLKGKVALVTGATGYLGSLLVRRLVERGVEVRALARSLDKAEALLGTPGVTLLKGGLDDAAVLRKAVTGCDWVFHCAAVFSGDLGSQRKVHVDGSRNVAEAAAAMGVGRLIHVSTVSVFGMFPARVVTDASPTDPGDEPYAKSKAEGERAVRLVSDAQGLPWVVVRPGAIFGPGASWTRFGAEKAKKRPIVFVGNGRGIIPAIHVDDLLELLLLAAVHPAAVGKCFNATIEPAPNWREFFTAYARLNGPATFIGIPRWLARLPVNIAAVFAKPNSPRKEFPETLREREYVYQYDTRDSERLLGWRPKFDLRSGTEACAPWLRAEGLLRP